MFKTPFAVAAIAVLSVGMLLPAQDAPNFPPAVKEHEWLQQFVGEWESESEAAAAPGQPAMKCKGTMSSKMLGKFWVVSNITGDMMGTPMTGLQTIGYDPNQKKYVGTWVDSMMNHLWHYAGTVDATGKKLTLEADGPSFIAADKLAKYRDSYEFKSKDHIVVTSSMQGEDGKWIVFMTGNVHRKKP